MELLRRIFAGTDDRAITQSMDPLWQTVSNCPSRMLSRARREDLCKFREQIGPILRCLENLKVFKTRTDFRATEPKPANTGVGNVLGSRLSVKKFQRRVIQGNQGLIVA